MLVIRLTRVGKKNSPAYRVVVADKKRAVKRKFIEILGHYNPTTNPKTLVIDKEKSLHWISLGAQPSDTVNNLMVRLDILPKEKIINKVYGKKTAKKDEDKAEAAPKETVKPEEPTADEAPADTEASTPEEVEAPEAEEAEVKIEEPTPTDNDEEKTE